MTKDQLLEKTNGGEAVFKYYLPEFDGTSKPFLSPLRAEKNPSASISKVDTGQYLLKDFGTGEALNCIDFIMKRGGLTYDQAIEKIVKDMKLNAKKMSENKAALELKIAGSPINYFNDYCPAERIGEYLERYDILNIESYTHNGHIYTGSKDNLIVGFKIADNCYKLYQPEGRVKHMWLGKENKPSDYQDVWGIQQLPKKCGTIVIVEGLKDAFVTNVNLNHKDIYAVGVDSVHTSIPAATITDLKSRCRNLMVCYDTDTTGVDGANKVAQQHNLKVCTLPDALKEYGGKDISDWFKAGLDIEPLEQALANAQVHTSSVASESSSVSLDNNLRQMLEMEKALKDRAKNTERPEPLITFQGNPVIIKGTINAIMGKQGSHKSRLAGGFASLMCSDRNSIEGGMGFEKPNGSPAHVVYIDTERNTLLEFPPAISAIQSHSGNENVEEYFHPVSVKGFSRGDRLEMIKTYVDYLQEKTADHLVAIIDVITDCVKDFNIPSETLDLFDYLGNLAEEKDITIIAVIHQNPGSDKGRGHTGTELGNKCSTAMSISYSGQYDLSKGIVTLSYQKNRHSKRLPNQFLKYDEKAQMLVALSEEEAKSLKASKRKADVMDVKAALLEIMPESGKEYSQQEVVNQLIDIFDCTKNTVKDRLEKIIEENNGEFEDEEGRIWKFSILPNKGSKTYYTLNRVEMKEE
ncbi:hypothetical protein [Leadbetterella sp. DM7]|uniref:hypothetical protein n=1 Tax=Leadbetterella sp. DM7 TaxID=3235085 RepID=UPI00349F03E5